MKFFQTLWRFLVAIQLLPALEGVERSVAFLRNVLIKLPRSASAAR